MLDDELEASEVEHLIVWWNKCIEQFLLLRKYKTSIAEEFFHTPLWNLSLHLSREVLWTESGKKVPSSKSEQLHLPACN
jgi:hypothetical protein